VRDGSIAGARAATGALAAYGERCTAARLMVDALVRVDDAVAAEVTAAELHAMGARASAAELTGTRAG